LICRDPASFSRRFL